MLILVLIDVQYSLKAIFSFEKGMIGQNIFSGSHHPVQKSPSKISDSLPHWGESPHTPHCYLENPMGSHHVATELSKQ